MRLLLFWTRMFRSNSTAEKEAKMGRRGQAMPEDVVKKIVDLLEATDMTIGEIAERTGYSRSVVAAVNRRYTVRDYKGRHSSWVVSPTLAL